MQINCDKHFYNKNQNSKGKIQPVKTQFHRDSLSFEVLRWAMIVNLAVIG
jgi:hypothetical protein